MFSTKKIFVVNVGILVTLASGGILALSTQATTEIESFPPASYFDHSTGREVESTIDSSSFISTIQNDTDNKQNIVVYDDNGNGGIITNENNHFRTYAGIKLDKTPIASISYDFTNDQKDDFVSILPATWLNTKSWRQARVVEVGSNYLITDQLLRKNILTQSTIIGTNGYQYVVKNNTGPTDTTPRNAIYLDKQIAPNENDSLGDYRSFFSAGQYVSYLIPTKAISENIQVTVSRNLGSHNFETLACKPYVPQTIDTITAVAIGQFVGDNNKDVTIVTHGTEEMNTSNVATTYNTDNHVLTFTISVPPSQVHSRNLTGSYVSFLSSPDKLFPIRQASTNQLVVDIVMPDNGDGVELFQAALLPGDAFLLTSNNDDNKHTLVYKGDGQGCFTYTGEMHGTILERSFGKVWLPNASTVSSESRSVITDLHANYLPVDSLSGRSVTIGSTSYPIEHNDQYHLYLSASAGDISDTTTDVLHQHITNTYKIVATNPTQNIDASSFLKATTLVVDIPSDIQAMIGGMVLEGAKPAVRSIDIDQDGDKDIIYLNNKHLFLKKNNEHS